MFDDIVVQKQMNFVEEYPNPLILSRESETDFYNAKLTLTNKTVNYVIFKVYFSKKALYCAAPSIFFIKPMSSTEVSIKCLEKSFDMNKIPPMKMLITVYPIEKVINTKEEVKEIFNEKKKENVQSQDITIAIEISTTLKPIRQTPGSNHNDLENEDINCEDLEISKAIEKMKNINSNYKGKIENKQRSITILESQLENLGRNKNLLQSKEKALTKTDVPAQIKKGKGFSQTVLLMLLLIFLALGGFLSKLKNSFFKEPIH